MTNQKTLQTDIVKRFMSDEEWREFKKEYWSNKHTQSSRDRSISLGAKITPTEKEALIAYTQDTDVSIKELKEMYKGEGDFFYVVSKTAIRIIHQHPGVLDRI